MIWSLSLWLLKNRIVKIIIYILMNLRDILPSCKLSWLLPVIVCRLAAEPRYRCPIVECPKSDHWFDKVCSIRSHCRRRHNTGITIESRDIIMARQNKKRLCNTSGRRQREADYAAQKAIRARMHEIMSDIGKLIMLYHKCFLSYLISTMHSAYSTTPVCLFAVFLLLQETM